MKIFDSKTFDKKIKAVTSFAEKSKVFENRPYYQTIFINGNRLMATDGKAMALCDVSDCVDNAERFSFPFDMKVVKSVECNDDCRLVVDGKVLENFMVKDFKYELAIPDGDYVERHLTFTDKVMKGDGMAVVKFKDGTVTIDYRDELETVAEYGDVFVEDDLLTGNDGTFNEFAIQLKYFLKVLNVSKDFVLRWYGDKKAVEFVTGDYRLIVMPMND